jgi:hypothetical protein
MRVLSPVGRFPLHLHSVSLKEGRITVNAEMGVWRSEVQLGREDLPLIGAAMGALLGVFLLGRASAGGC